MTTLMRNGACGEAPLSAKEDVFGEHVLRTKLFGLLDSYRKEIERLAEHNGRRPWPPPPMQWEELKAVRLLSGDYVDDIIKEIQDAR